MKLKGKNLWNVEADINDSWGWKNILKVKDKIKERIVHKIGNGRCTSTWYDNWSSIGLLNQYIRNRDLYDAILATNVYVKDMTINGKWVWPSE